MPSPPPHGSYNHIFCRPSASDTLSAVKIIPRQLFEVPIQAAVGNTIIARRTLSALRADVTAGLYGGEILLLPPPFSLG